MNFRFISRRKMNTFFLSLLQSEKERKPTTLPFFYGPIEIIKETIKNTYFELIFKVSIYEINPQKYGTFGYMWFIEFSNVFRKKVLFTKEESDYLNKVDLNEHLLDSD